MEHTFYMKVKVYDAISSYEMKPEDAFTDSEKDFIVFQRQLKSTVYFPETFYDGIRFGFYHKLVSNHLAVSSGGNHHSSYFYFKAGISSGELCPTTQIDSLNSDLGLRWVYVSVSKDMWSDNYEFVFRNNLLGSDCTFTISEGSNNFELLSGDTLALGYREELGEGKPIVFFYEYEEFKEVTGGHFYDENDSRECLDSINGGVSKGVGYFTNQFAVLECPADKVRVLNECLVTAGATGGCLHVGSPCKKCQKDHALDSSSGTCHACPNNCNDCFFDSVGSSAACKICNERYTTSSGNCVPCTSNEIWDSKSFNCFPGVELTLKSGYTFNGLTSPGNPFSNNSYLVVEAKYSVGPSGSYEEELIKVRLDGSHKSEFRNITSPVYNYQDNSYIFFITEENASKFEEFSFEFFWDLDTPDEVVTIDYVKAYSNIFDYSKECLILNADGTCQLCNMYQLKYRGLQTGECLLYNKGKYGPGINKFGNSVAWIDCSTDNSVKYCWGKNGGAVECYEGFVLINGHCLSCNPNCGTCYQEGSSPDHANHYKTCPIGSKTGLKKEVSGIESCAPCESSTCLNCLNNFQICEDCGSDQNIEILEGKCLKKCQAEKEVRLMTNLECVDCHENCLGCLGEGNHQCLTCASGILKTETNCTDSAQGFCCYKCPEGCSDCSWDGQCVENLGDIFIKEVYFMKSKGKIVIVFNRIFSIKSFESKYEIESTGNLDLTNCSLEIPETDECRIKILNTETIINDENMTLTIKEGTTLNNIPKKKKYKISKKKNIKVTKLEFYKKDEIIVTTLGKISSSAVQISLGSLILTDRVTYLQLLKLAQYVDFMLYFNIDYPHNLYTFLEYFNKGLFDNAPNPMEDLHDTHCRPPHKFIENGAKCFYFDNLGLHYIGLGNLLILKIISSLLAKASEKCQKKGNKKTWMMLINTKFNISVFVYLMDMFYFELVLYSSLQLKRLDFKGHYLILNSFLGFFSLFLCLWLIYFFYTLSKNIVDIKLKIIKVDSSGKKFKKQEWFPLFIISENDIRNKFGRYFAPIKKIKNFFSGFIVVFLYHKPFLQIFLQILINFTYLGLFIWKNPLKSKISYIGEVIFQSFVCLSLLLCLMLVSYLRMNNEEHVYFYIGNLGILIFSLIFMIIFLIGIYHSISNFVEFIQKICGKYERKRARRKIHIVENHEKLDIKEDINLDFDERRLEVRGEKNFGKIQNDFKKKNKFEIGRKSKIIQNVMKLREKEEAKKEWTRLMIDNKKVILPKIENKLRLNKMD